MEKKGLGTIEINPDGYLKRGGDFFVEAVNLQIGLFTRCGTSDQRLSSG